MKLLITGGAGFIGTNLISYIRSQNLGFEIRVLDNESLGSKSYIEGFDVEFVNGDICDPEAVNKCVDGMDAVVHLAADTRVMDSIENPKNNFEINVGGTINILEAMRASGTKRLINASTGGAILGEVEPPSKEDMLPNPSSPYGASKNAVEGYCSAYQEAYGMEILSTRFSNVYGPNSYHKGSVVAHFYKQIQNGERLTVFGDGNQVRDYIYVDDLCAGIVSGIKSSVSGPVQLATGIPITLNELINEIREVVQPSPVKVDYRPFRAGEIHTTYCDISKAKNELGFQPKFELKNGLEQTWRWFYSKNSES